MPHYRLHFPMAPIRLSQWIKQQRLDGDERTIYWKQFERRRTGFYSAVAARVKARFANEKETVVKAYLRGVNHEAGFILMQQALENDRDAWQRLLLATYITVGISFGSGSFRGLKSLSGPETKVDDISDDDIEKLLAAISGETVEGSAELQAFFDLFPRRTVDYVKRIAGIKITRIDDTTLRLVRLALSEGVSEGEGIDKLAERLRRAYEGFDDIRSEAIARTEVIAGSNHGSMVGAEASGIALNKVWLATRDDRTREEHEVADGQVALLHEPFEVAGEELMFPGDSSMGASAHNVINCFPGDVVVCADDIELGMERYYTGELLILELETGDILPGTPNHPIATERGWIALNMLDQSDRILRCSDIDLFSRSMYPDVQYRPACIGDIVKAAKASGMLERISSALMDFHGDGGHGDVAMVGIDQCLSRICRSPYLFEQGAETSFPLGSTHEMHLPGLLRSRVDIHTAPLQALGLALSSGHDVVAQQKTTNDIARHTELFCSRLFRHAFDVASNDFRFDLSLPGAFSKRYGLALRSFRNIATSKPGIDRWNRNVQLPGDLTTAQAALIQFTNIRQVRSIKFVGHVYNLQTHKGWYIASGIIASNCRCTQTYEPIEE